MRQQEQRAKSREQSARNVLVLCLALCCLLSALRCSAAGKRLIEPFEYVAEIECNSFGPFDQEPRIAVLFRDRDKSIIDWRWYDPKQHRPHRLPSGDYLLIFEDATGIHVVKAGCLYSTRTEDDVELFERTWLPQEKRRKLGSGR